MNNNQSYYIASCVFTAKYPELSKKIQQYIHNRYQMAIVRCCVPSYKVQQFEAQMEESHRQDWGKLPDCADFRSGNTVYSLCHNCAAIIEESRPGVHVKSLWELILSDKSFCFPDYRGREITLQDCWRAKDHTEEQNAVRTLLKKMNCQVQELPDNRTNTDFCGVSLYRPAPARNLKMAPHRFVDHAAGKFLPHTKEEQEELMQEYCKRFKTEMVVSYCHYCQEGLELGGVNARHIASLLFEPETANANQ